LSGVSYPKETVLIKLGWANGGRWKPDNTVISLKNRNSRKILLMSVIYLSEVYMFQISLGILGCDFCVFATIFASFIPANELICHNMRWDVQFVEWR